MYAGGNKGHIKASFNCCVLYLAGGCRLERCLLAAGAVQGMQQSSQAAAACLMKHRATACTDVTGFGLLGHLAEMARASQVPSVLINVNDFYCASWQQEVHDVAQLQP